MLNYYISFIPGFPEFSDPLIIPLLRRKTGVSVEVRSQNQQ